MKKSTKENKQIMVESVLQISETCLAILKVKAFVLTFEWNNRVMQLCAYCLAAESILNFRTSVKVWKELHTSHLKDWFVILQILKIDFSFIFSSTLSVENHFKYENFILD